jgi:hypothetical protein
MASIYRYGYADSGQRLAEHAVPDQQVCQVKDDYIIPIVNLKQTVSLKPAQSRRSNRFLDFSDELSGGRSSEKHYDTL